MKMELYYNVTRLIWMKWRGRNEGKPFRENDPAVPEREKFVNQGIFGTLRDQHCFGESVGARDRKSQPERIAGNRFDSGGGAVLSVRRGDQQ